MTDIAADPPPPPTRPPAEDPPALPPPWRLDGVDPRHQALAVRCAAQDGVPLGQWLGRAITAAASDAGGARRLAFRMLAGGLIAGAVLGGAASYVLTGFDRLASAPPPLPAAGRNPVAAAPAPAGAPAPAAPSPSAATPAAPLPAPAPVTPVDPLAELRKAARDGDASAQFELGARYAGGDGTAQDWSEAVLWFRLAAEQGMGRAQHNLAVLYERGRGIEADPREAARWYERAAEQGYAPSQFNLGAALARGIDGRPDMARAIAWFERAAERLPQAHMALAEIHDGGLAPGGRDLGRARGHYLLAAAAGDARAAARLEELTPEAVARETLREIQQLLARLNIYKGDLDGLTGPRTAAAIRRFQREQRIEEDGRSSQALLERLRAAVAPR
jgi:hypothetical protein